MSRKTYDMTDLEVFASDCQELAAKIEASIAFCHLRQEEAVQGHVGADREAPGRGGQRPLENLARHRG